jgi:hypothetical protein
LAEIKLTAEPSADIGFSEADDLERLLPTLVTRDKLDLGLANGELVRDELDDGCVCSALDRGSCDLNAQDIVSPAGYLVSGASRSDMQPKYGIGHLRYHLIKRSWALSILSQECRD